MGTELVPTKARQAKADRQTTREGKHTEVAFAAPGTNNKTGEFPIGEIYSIQSLSRNAWISRPFVTTMFIGCLSMRTSAKLYQLASRDLYMDSPHILWSC